jgi:L-lactate dehydrogenase complex protein LldE
MPTVALFVTCVADQFFPDTAQASVRVLEAAGVDVVFPAGQTCCGQPALAAGEPGAATRLARHHLAVFGDLDGARDVDAPKIDAIVTPSGSCAAMVCHHFPTLLTELRAETEAIAARTFELTQYLVDVLGVDDIGARLDTTVTLHDACHGLRTLGVGDGTRRLLRRAGATLVEMTEPDTCCGFGGVFSLGFPEVSTRLADDKLDNAASTSARYLVSTDLACLMHLDGRRRKIDPARGPQPIHVADLLASGLGAPR